VGNDGTDLNLVHRMVKKARSGDEESFGELVKMYHQRVYGLVYGMTNNVDDAKDLAQQTWVKAWNSGDSRWRLSEGRYADCHAGGRIDCPVLRAA
jgi:DNA-directed RNA polymerase specialized sigma24 family protein